MEKNYSLCSDKTEEISDYVVGVFKPEDETLRNARRHLVEEGLPNEATVHEMDGRHLEILARACAPRKIVEIGTLGGYSTICLARALEANGILFALEINEKNAVVARKNIEDAGLADRVQVIVGDARQTLLEIAPEGPFDLVFVDADKVGYPEYLEWAEKNVRVGGMIIGDNTFYFDKITATTFGSEAQEKSVKAMQTFNQRLAENKNFRSTIFPTGEGLTVGIRLR